ncbi:MAG: ABC transporter permease subunit [Oscillospiraceae bacterium]|nr:ABC transporter permease subunit [Oscillospiraceae bacterium]
MTAIMKREIASYFTSPLGYVFLAVFYGFSGLFLWMGCLRAGQSDMGVVFSMMFFIMIILIPILTMRTMADDKRQRTDQLTLTSPVSLFGIVAGKFLAAFFVFFCAVLVMLVYALFLASAVKTTDGVFGWATFWGNFTGMLLMGGVFISLGIFISNLTENQMIAAIGSIGANIALCMFDLISGYVPNETLKSVLNNLSVFYKYSEFTIGIFSLKNIVFFLSIIVIFNFLTMRFIDRRRWS